MSIGQSSPGWAPVDAGLRQYLETIRRFPILSREEESRLARLGGKRVIALRRTP